MLKFSCCGGKLQLFGHEWERKWDGQSLVHPHVLCLSGRKMKKVKNKIFMFEWKKN